MVINSLHFRAVLRTPTDTLCVTLALDALYLPLHKSRVPQSAFCTAKATSKRSSLYALDRGGLESLRSLCGMVGFSTLWGGVAKQSGQFDSWTGDFAKGAGICRKAAWHSSRFKYPNVIDVNSHLKIKSIKPIQPINRTMPHSEQVSQSNQSFYPTCFPHFKSRNLFPEFVNGGDVSEVAPSAEMMFLHCNRTNQIIRSNKSLKPPPFTITTGRQSCTFPNRRNAEIATSPNPKKDWSLRPFFLSSLYPILYPFSWSWV